VSTRARRNRRAAARVPSRAVVERSTGSLIVGVCVVVAVLIIGAAAWQPVDTRIRLSRYESDTLAEVGSSPASAGCRATYRLAVSGTTSQAAEGEGSFVTAPPAFGPYSADTADDPTGVPEGAAYYDASDTPTLTDLVGDEYAGYTILWYDHTITGAKLAAIQAVVRKLDDSADDRDELIAAPWTSADAASVSGSGALTRFPSGTHVAFTHWSAGGVGQSGAGQQSGVFEFCAGVSGSALKRFMQAFPYLDSPSPGVLPTASAG
jgi:hypothetical protein